MDQTAFFDSALAHWPTWLVSLVLIVAAIIDGWKLKVPNWITFPMIISGWGYSFVSGGFSGLGWSLLGTIVGLALLYFLYSVGGMGAGDVKLLAGIGAWVYVEHTFNIFAVTTIVGAIMAVIMVAWTGNWSKHYAQFNQILSDFARVRNADQLYEEAAERKPRMLLLPYGIPMTVAALGYFAFQGMYF